MYLQSLVLNIKRHHIFLSKIEFRTTATVGSEYNRIQYRARTRREPDETIRRATRFSKRFMPSRKSDFPLLLLPSQAVPSCFLPRRSCCARRRPFAIGLRTRRALRKRYVTHEKRSVVAAPAGRCVRISISVKHRARARLRKS